MTEQPVETEQQFLGNASYIAPRIVQPPAKAVIGQMDVGAVEFVALPEIPLQHYAPDAHRVPYQPFNIKDDDLSAADANFQRKVEGQRIPLDLQAELHAGNAVQSLQNGELDEGIAWLQSALAFAQNHRHTLAEETAR
jgi:hypothetical protein